MASRRQNLSSKAERLGLTWLLEALPRRDSILVLNYHRVGDSTSCQYDPDLFSATSEQFHDQVLYLKKNFNVTTLRQVQQMVDDPSKLKGFHVLLTFDDGYRDNFEQVFPILRSEGLEGTFFLTTSYLDSDTLPWWDQIAFLVRQTQKQSISVENRVINFHGRSRIDVLREVLRIYSHQESRDSHSFISELASACGIALCDIPEDTAFMSWEQAQEMVRGGMAIGSHTCTHPILARQSADQQFEELKASKQILEQRLGREIDTLAYPVGHQAAFDHRTFQALEETGYSYAFSFYGGLNSRTALHRYNILRTGVEQHVTMPVLRLQTAIAASFTHAI